MSPEAQILRGAPAPEFPEEGPELELDDDGLEEEQGEPPSFDEYVLSMPDRLNVLLTPGVLQQEHMRLPEISEEDEEKAELLDSVHDALTKVHSVVHTNTTAAAAPAVKKHVQNVSAQMKGQIAAVLEHFTSQQEKGEPVDWDETVTGILDYVITQLLELADAITTIKEQVGLEVALVQEEEAADEDDDEEEQQTDSSVQSEGPLGEEEVTEDAAGGTGQAAAWAALLAEAPDEQKRVPHSLAQQHIWEGMLRLGMLRGMAQPSTEKQLKEFIITYMPYPWFLEEPSVFYTKNRERYREHPDAFSQIKDMHGQPYPQAVFLDDSGKALEFYIDGRWDEYPNTTEGRQFELWLQRQ